MTHKHLLPEVKIVLCQFAQLELGIVEVLGADFCGHGTDRMPAKSSIMTGQRQRLSIISFHACSS
ncbi:MAG: hypothetical protein RLP44_10535 [Aggregatilineales bacterium]